jgi:hypothetical protein
MEEIILIDRDIGFITRKIKAENDRGEPIPTDEITEHKIMCRVSYQAGGVWPSKQWEGGLTIDTSPYVLAGFDADIEQGDTLQWRKRNYSVGVVTRPEIGGGFTCTQAPLTEVK